MDSQVLDTGAAWGHLPARGLSPEIAQESSSASKSGKRRIPQGGRSLRPAALQAAWASHTLKQAIAAVRSASDADYGAFGWDRGDLLARLQWLQGEIDRRPAGRRAALTVALARSLRPPALGRGPGVSTTPLIERRPAAGANPRSMT